MKVYVRHADGELMFPSFKDFEAMHRLGFVAADDLVRRENSERWVRAADLPELRAQRHRRREDGRQLRRVAVLALLFFFALVVTFRLATMQKAPAAAPSRFVAPPGATQPPAQPPARPGGSRTD